MLIWEPREGTPESIGHWNRLRSMVKPIIIDPVEDEEPEPPKYEYTSIQRSFNKIATINSIMERIENLNESNLRYMQEVHYED